MKYDKMYHLTLQQIHIFLECHEECNYSTIATKYSYTPSAISKLIHTMEELLGYKLFIKDKKDLKPTVEADILAIQWAEMIDKFESGLNEINEMHNEIRKGVRLGVLSSAEFSKLYIEDRLETNASPQLRDKIIWGRKDMCELLAALNEDIFDIIVVTSRMVVESGIQFKNMKTVFSSPDAVYIPYGHPLFEKEIRSFADFKDYAFILLDPALYPENYSLLFDLSRKYGFTPKIATICNNTEAARDNLYFGRGLYIANSLITSDWQNDFIRKVELINEPYTDLVAVWKKKNTQPDVLEVIEAITR